MTFNCVPVSVPSRPCFGSSSSSPAGSAASETLQAARETKSPLLEKLAIRTMIVSSLSSAAVGAVRLYRMVEHDEEKAEERAYKRLRAELDRQDRAHQPEPLNARSR